MTLSQTLEQAEGPSRELDAEIYATKCLDNRHVVSAYPAPSGKGRVVQRWVDGGTSWCVSPRYTASIDAALTLVPEGCGMMIALNPTEASCQLWSAPDAPHLYVNCKARTPAIAIALAALRARAHEGESNNG